MTNKECVEHLKKLKIGIVFMNTLISDEADKDKIDLEALSYAIKALEERPQGEWINQSQGAKYPCECSECHTEPFCNDEGYVLSNFCPNCGADMRVKDELNRVKDELKEVPKERLFNPFDHRTLGEI